MKQARAASPTGEVRQGKGKKIPSLSPFPLTLFPTSTRSLMIQDCYISIFRLKARTEGEIVKLRTALNIFDFWQFTRSELSHKLTISLKDYTIVAIAAVFRDES